MFSKEELEVILWLSNNPITSSKNINEIVRNISKKVEHELYPDHNFIKYITSNNDNILKIYKNKSRANYEIIVKDCRTKTTYGCIELISEYMIENDSLYFDFMVHGDETKLSLHDYDLVFEKSS